VSRAVGFDLDMTLIDSRPGIAAAFRELSARTGVPIDTDAVVSRLGPPLRTEMRHWFPESAVEDAVTTYRALYPDFAIAPTVPLPGAREALAAIRAYGLRVVVVTSKLGRLAEMHLAHLGIVADEVAGDVFAEGKAEALVRFGAGWFVGDHIGDMIAARTAAIPGIGVTTGPCDADALRTAGASYVLPDLTGLPALLDGIAVGPERAAG
jgi:phosphoglycolate phosphatase